MEVHDILAGIGVLVGLVGIVLVFLPGLVLQVAAVFFWAFEESSPTGWVVLAMVVVIAGTAMIFKYLHPGRQLRAAGLPGWLLFLAVMAATVGLFAVPVVGAPLFFVATIYVFERVRRGRAQAWPSTKAAVRALVTSIGIELAGGFLILVVFVAGAFLT
ncbi:MAG TPA: DUF456 domain-containing protein [Acidimicrobiia bacterium]|nr:DUF456 domain-containing protein [Acidimicrobiia bacterium]